MLLGRCEEVEMRLLRDPGSGRRHLGVLLAAAHAEDQAARSARSAVVGEGDHVHVDVVFILTLDLDEKKPY